MPLNFPSGSQPPSPRRDEIICWTSCPATREAAGRPGGWLRSTGELASRGSDSLPEESTGSVRFGSRVKASFRRGHQWRGRHSLTSFIACLALFPPPHHNPPPIQFRPRFSRSSRPIGQAFLISDTRQIFNPARRHHSDGPNTGVQRWARQLRSNSGGEGGVGWGGGGGGATG